jgi:hypothetical protein
MPPDAAADDDALAGLQAGPLDEPIPRHDCGRGKAGSLLDGQLGRPGREEGLFRDDGFGKGAAFLQTCDPKHVIARFELGDAGADGVHEADEVRPHRTREGSAGHHLERTLAKLPVDRIHRRRGDRDGNLAGSGSSSNSSSRFTFGDVATLWITPPCGLGASAPPRAR